MQARPTGPSGAQRRTRQPQRGRREHRQADRERPGCGRRYLQRLRRQVVRDRRRRAGRLLSAGRPAVRDDRCPAGLAGLRAGHPCEQERAGAAHEARRHRAQALL